MRHFLFEDKDYEINPRYKVRKKSMHLLQALPHFIIFQSIIAGKVSAGRAAATARV
ncbi:hypothetical protein [Treponema socranskii]|uniref:hypothetical protein n=1 Tax=Treponema socranskii TaxID=53419 RepID=UPI003D8B732A